MARETVDPVVQVHQRTGGGGTEITTHPSFAQIAASRVSGAAYLYGSDMLHQHYMTIRINASELHRDLSRDWAFPRGEIIEVALSESQWAHFVSSPNAGTGSQCTLRFLAADANRYGSGDIPAVPKPPAKTEVFHREAKRKLESAINALDKLRARILDGKGNNKESLSLLEAALREIGGNKDFVADQFNEFMEDRTEAAKSEVLAFMQHAITRAGLDALRDAPLALDRPNPPALEMQHTGRSTDVPGAE